MRRVLLPLFLALGLSAAATGCGVTADDRAAVVGETTIGVDRVDALARDAVFVQNVVQGGTAAEDEGSTLPGDLARSTLLFEMQRVALLEELDRWGVELDDADLEAARAQLEPQLRAAGSEEPAATTMDSFAEYVAAQTALGERLSRIDPEDDADLRRIYDSLPAFWDRVCATIVYVPLTDADAAAAAVEDGVGPEELAEEVETAQLVADPAQSCVLRAQLPAELTADADRATAGEVRGPVEVPGGANPGAYVYRVERLERLGFDEAREDVAQIAASLVQQGATAQYLNALLVDRTWVNPRYGSLDFGGGQLSIAPPTAPVSETETTLLPADAATGGGGPTP